ncbi:major facilitator superfamily protein [Escherichia coli]|uniref:Major facilitator superfamily protein n=1 Tax=Escherichia coli TaxID=562 RepID=A0A376S8Z1_ECOLX|nr:major facilitator superfamily protein [Escherichia coli]
MPLLTAPIPFCYRVESLVCRQSFLHQQNENLLNQLHHAQHWLDHRSAARHAVGDAEHQSALLAGSYLFRVSHAFHSNLGKRSEKIIATETGSVWSPKVLLQDKALLWFTCSGFLASLFSGAFASCISQYVMVIADGDFAEKVVAVVLPVNAAMVVTLQYSVGRRLNPANIRALMTAGTLCFVIGLVGFIFSGNSLLLWGMSAAVFTVGEIIYAPGEYMLIDHIAPPGMKASYFSAQSLGWLGAAINPLVSGIVLTSLPPFSLFIILALVIIAAWVLMLKGIRARPWGQPALC